MTISLFVWGDSMNLILLHLIMWIIINIYIQLSFRISWPVQIHDTFIQLFRRTNDQGTTRTSGSRAWNIDSPVEWRMKTTSGRIDRSVAIIPIPGWYFMMKWWYSSIGNHKIESDDLVLYHWFEINDWEMRFVRNFSTSTFDKIGCGGYFDNTHKTLSSRYFCGYDF